MRKRRRKWPTHQPATRRAFMQAMRREVETSARVPAVRDELTCPLWLVPGASVLVRRVSGGGTHALTVQGVDWPWCVFFYELPGATHPSNVLRPTDEKGR